MRTLRSVTWLLSASAMALSTCGKNLARALNTLPATAPLPLSSDEDRVIAAALLCATTQPRPRCGEGPPVFDHMRVVVDTSSDHVSAHTLSSSDSLQYLLLSKEEIQALADKYGDFVYISVGAPNVFGDSAEIDVQTKSAYSRRLHHTASTVFMIGGLFCSSIFFLRSDQWTFAHRGPHCMEV